MIIPEALHLESEPVVLKQSSALNSTNLMLQNQEVKYHLSHVCIEKNQKKVDITKIPRKYDEKKINTRLLIVILTKGRKCKTY